LDTHDVQLQYWNEFTRLKRDAIYINRYHGDVERVDRGLEMVSAVTSSAAIGGWAIWRDAAFLWGAVIAATRVLTAIRPFLPYKARLKALAKFGAELDGLALVAETDWLAVSRLTISDEEIHRRTMSLKKKALAAQVRSFGDASLPERPNWVQAAETAANTYMQSFVLTFTPEDESR
jgi:hypothetical protein